MTDNPKAARRQWRRGSAKRRAHDTDRHFGILRTVAEAISRTSDVDDMLVVALDALTGVTGHEISSLHLLAPDGKTLRLRSERGMSPLLREVTRLLPVEEGLIGRVAATGTPVGIDNITAAHEVLSTAESVLEREGIHGFVCVPIASRGRVLGTLALGRRTRKRFTEREVALLQATADLIALALENARLFSDTQRQLEDLKHAEAQLIQTDRLSASGRLALGTAHEVRNALMVILGRAQLLLNEPNLSAQVRDGISVIIKATSRATEILRDVLLFSRQSAPTRRPCSLIDQVRTVLDLTRYELERHGIQVRTEFHDCPPVWADEGQIQQVLLNLVENARQAMVTPATERVLTVRVRPLEYGGCIEVLDTGPGIPEDLLPRIFDPFFTTKPEGEGTGLGLWVAYSVIERHGGHLRAENRPEGGAAFVIQLWNRKPLTPER